MDADEAGQARANRRVTVTTSAPTAGRASRLDPVYNPQSIAVVGASANPYALGNWVYGNLRRDFPGALFPINARSPEVLGDQTYPDVESLPQPVDLVVVLVPAAQVPDVIERSIRLGHRSAYVITSGFSEADTDEGRALQSRVAELAREHSFPVVGPNCIGFMNNHRSVMANFSLMPDADRPEPGPVALVSQSGGFGSYILNRAVNGHVKVGFFASTGNECDVTVADLLLHVVEQPEIQVVGLFAEAFRNPGAFLAAARRAAELDKVIISVTPGSSDAVARAAFSHTASTVGSSDVYGAVCRQYGIVQADSIDQLVDYLLLLQDGRRMAGRNLGVITSSGGAGVLIAGSADGCGLSLPELDATVQAEFKTLIPSFGSGRNPIDTTAALGSMPPENIQIIHDLLADVKEIDAVITLVWMGEGVQADAVFRTYQRSTKPIVPVVTIDPELMAGRGLPSYADPTRAVRALAMLANVSERSVPSRLDDEPDAERAARARAILTDVADKPFLLESTAKDLLALYGIPVAREYVCHSEDAAAKAAAAIGGKVVVKALSYDLPHKSDAGGLVVGVETEDEVRSAYRTVSALAGPSVTIDSVLVQQMVPSRLELALGLHRDPVFGPVVAVGLGGVLVEILESPRLLHIPFTLEQARAAIEGIASGRIRHATRGLRDDDVDALARAAVGLGTLGLELPEVESVDINPVMVHSDGLCAVDALVVAGEVVGNE